MYVVLRTRLEALKLEDALAWSCDSVGVIVITGVGTARRTMLVRWSVVLQASAATLEASSGGTWALDGRRASRVPKSVKQDTRTAHVQAYASRYLSDSKHHASSSVFQHVLVLVLALARAFFCCSTVALSLFPARHRPSRPSSALPRPHSAACPRASGSFVTSRSRVALAAHMPAVTST